MPLDNKTNQILGQHVGNIVQTLLNANSTSVGDNDAAAQSAVSGIATSFPLMASMISNAPEAVSDDMRAQFETLMKKQEEDNDERVMRENRMIGLLEDISDKLGASLEVQQEQNEPERIAPKKKLGAGLADKIHDLTAAAPTAIRVAGKGAELAVRGGGKLVQGAAAAAGGILKPAAKLVQKGIAPILAGLETMGSKLPGMGAMGKALATTGGKLAASMVGFVLDAVMGMFKSDDWNVSKVSAAIGGAIGGTFDNKILNMFVNAGKWAALGASVGSAVPVVGTLIGGIIGGIIGAITGYFGGEKIAKFADEFGTKFGAWISETTDNVVRIMKETFSADNVGKALATTFDAVVDTIVTSMNWFGEKIPSMLDTVKKEGELPILAEWKQDLRTARALIKKRLLEVVTEDRRMISVAIPESNEK